MPEWVLPGCCSPPPARNCSNIRSEMREKSLLGSKRTINSCWPYGASEYTGIAPVRVKRLQAIGCFHPPLAVMQAQKLEMHTPAKSLRRGRLVGGVTYLGKHALGQQATAEELLLQETTSRHCCASNVASQHQKMARSIKERQALGILKRHLWSMTGATQLQEYYNKDVPVCSDLGCGPSSSHPYGNVNASNI
eukprot:4774334-Amphidinium_carterae.1